MKIDADMESLRQKRNSENACIFQWYQLDKKNNKRPLISARRLYRFL